MKLKLLRRTHEDYDLEAMDRHVDLYEGGERMRKNVGKHIVQNDVEPEQVYRKRLALAGSQYLNHCGSIGAFFSSFLFSKPIRLDGDEYWDEFSKSVDEKDHALSTFLRGRFDEAIVKRQSFWRIEFPSPTSKIDSLADFEAQGLGNAKLEIVPTETLVNWKRNEDGEFDWLLEYTKTCELVELEDDDKTVTETWTRWRRDGSAQRWQIAYKGQPPSDDDDAPEVDPPFNPLKEIPLVELCLPASLWLMGHLAGPQTEAFRKRVALSWSMDRSCYAMPYFKLEDRKRPPKMGAGYYVMIGPNDGAGYIAPPEGPYAVIDKYISGLKDEFYRVAQVMARGIDNNAAAVGRSGESKQADDKATEIVVAAYAAIIKQAVAVTAKKIARFRNVEPPVVTGMENYAILDESVVVATAATAETLQIPSVTYKRELFKRVVTAQLSDLDEATRSQIDKEIDEGVTAESMMATMPGGGVDGDGTDPESEQEDTEEQGAKAEKFMRGKRQSDSIAASVPSGVMP